ncbi:MAG: hypothetical protein ACYC61_08460 [Isosphaeraceae bacterium]
MIDMLWRSLRRAAPILLALGLILSPAATTTIRAQEEFDVNGGSKSKGDPVPYYLGAGMLSMLVLFVVAKSARR